MNILNFTVYNVHVQVQQRTLYIFWTVQCTVHSVQCTDENTIHIMICTMYSVQLQQRTLYIFWTVQCTVHIVQCTAENTMHIINCILYSVQVQQRTLYILWTVQFTVNSLHCTADNTIHKMNCILYSVQCKAENTLHIMNCTVLCIGTAENTIYILNCTINIQVQPRTLHILTVHCTVYYIWQTVLSETRCLSFLYSNRIGLNASYTIPTQSDLGVHKNKR